MAAPQYCTLWAEDVAEHHEGGFRPNGTPCGAGIPSHTQARVACSWRDTWLSSLGQGWRQISQCSAVPRPHR